MYQPLSGISVGDPAGIVPELLGNAIFEKLVSGFKPAFLN